MPKIEKLDLNETNFNKIDMNRTNYAIVSKINEIINVVNLIQEQGYTKDLDEEELDGEKIFLGLNGMIDDDLDEIEEPDDDIDIDKESGSIFRKRKPR